jgi:hypothetical protein
LGPVRARGLVSTLVTVALTVGSAGCAGRPPGTDGELVNGWPVPASPAFVVPVAGTCYTSETTDVDVLEPLVTKRGSCDEPHATETVYAGAFKSPVADQSIPPRNAELTAAWAECERGAVDYLGDDWHHARADMRIFVPTSAQWSGGARFFRCDIVEVKSEMGVIVQRSTSAKDGLRGARPLGKACAVLIGETKDGAYDDTKAVPCTETHRLEYTGFIIAAEGPYPTDADAFDRAYDDGCQKTTAQYLGMTVAQLRAHQQVSWTWWGVNERHWAFGDRSTRCYVWLPPVPDVRRSVKGMGNTSL